MLTQRGAGPWPAAASQAASNAPSGAESPAQAEDLPHKFSKWLSACSRGSAPSYRRRWLFRRRPSLRARREDPV